MISTRQLANALYGIWLLYKFDIRALTYFEKTPQAFYSSFVVALVLAPMQIAHFLLDFDARKTSLALVPYVVVQVLSYIVSWTIFPFAMLYVGRLLDRAPRYLWYMTPYIWMQLPLNLALVAAQLLTDTQILPLEVLRVVGPVVLVTFVIYGTFLAAIGLQVTTGTALSLVVLDYVLGLLVHMLIAQI